jgi:AcrR family transcriptional regulator
VRPAVEGPDRDRSPKWQRRPEQRRREILDSALWVFGRFGYQRATLADVAERAGVSPGTVSHYFGSKGELFQEVIAQHFMGFVVQEEALLASSAGPVRPLLHQLLRRLWDHAWTPGILELMQVVQVEAARVGFYVANWVNGGGAWWAGSWNPGQGQANSELWIPSRPRAP